MNTLRRALAHRVLHRGVVHRLAVADIRGRKWSRRAERPRRNCL